MIVLYEMRRRARVLVGPFLGLALTSYFVYHTIEGDRGLRAWRDINQQLHVASDQIGAPTSAKAIAGATERLIRMYANCRKTQFPTGTYHLTAGGATSWHGFALAIVATAFQGRRAPIVTPTLTADLSSFAKRPKNLLLSSQKFLTTFGFQLGTWQQQLHEVLAEASGGEIPAEDVPAQSPDSEGQPAGSDLVRAIPTGS